MYCNNLYRIYYILGYAFLLNQNFCHVPFEQGPCTNLVKMSTIIFGFIGKYQKCILRESRLHQILPFLFNFQVGSFTICLEKLRRIERKVPISLNVWSIALLNKTFGILLLPKNLINYIRNKWKKNTHTVKTIHSSFHWEFKNLCL